MLLWSSTFEIFAQNKIDSTSIENTQIKNIYIGLKQSEQYRIYYYDCLQSSNQLKLIIDKQDQKLKKSLDTIKVLNNHNEELNKKIIDSSVSIEELKNKKTPWYKHPILYGILGFIGGIYLMK
jgi:hypothetical protein